MLLRIDFRADDQIRSPDVNGTIYLDPKTYQIRLAELQLSKLVAEVREITAVKVRTIFRELSPNILVFDRVIARCRLNGRQIGDLLRASGGREGGR